jgi:hypothetical protein
LRKTDRIASAGSCFAGNLVPYLERFGYTYLRAETRHSAFRAIPSENVGYEAFSAAYGHIYTVRQLLQLFRRSRHEFTPIEDRWKTSLGLIDPFRPGLRYHALTDREFELLREQHYGAVRAVFEQADVFIFTLGLTEAWVSRLDGSVFPSCPGTVAGDFDESKHMFVNFTVTEMVEDLETFMRSAQLVNPSLRFILTVSPVPLVATATSDHVLCASTYSKAALRVVAEDVARMNQCVTYFPAYEIVTGPQAPTSFFDADRRSVTAEAIDTVVDAFLAHCEEAGPRIRSGLRVRCGQVLKDENRGRVASVERQRLSRNIADVECEEAMLDVND